MRFIVNAFWTSLLLVICAQGQLISSRKPDGLILSTGNLYFMSHDAAGAAVWRTSQSSVPGQETILYWEAGAKFGDIVFAQVNVTFFGYFFAVNAGVIAIRRVPLTGGNAIVLATITNVDVTNSHRNLVTDGVNLYWQDDVAVRKMPIGGGASTVLDRTRPNTPTAGIVLDNGRIIYASVDDIRFVPTAGANTDPSVRTIAKASSAVTALHVGSSGVHWGERSGAVRVKIGPTIKTLPGPPNPTNLIATSISSAGVSTTEDRAWTRCGSQSCQLVLLVAPSGALREISADALGVSVTAGRDVFWGDANGVHRLNHPFGHWVATLASRDTRRYPSRCGELLQAVSG